MYSPFFESFFSPPTIVVVSEERLKAAELRAKEKQLLQVKVQLENLQEFYEKLEADVKLLQPAKAGKDLDALDGVNG